MVVFLRSRSIDFDDILVLVWSPSFLRIDDATALIKHVQEISLYSLLLYTSFSGAPMLWGI